MTTTTPDPLSSAREQAAAQVASIVELYEAHSLLCGDGDDDETHESVDVDGQTFTSLESLDDYARERALSVESRGGWVPIGTGEDRSIPVEFQILLCTGGPAVRLRGTLDSHGEPEDAPDVECQDWGTQWTKVRYTPEEGDALLWFARLFYYGDA